MREIALRIWDDVEFLEGNKVEAATTVTLGLDGNWIELDLHAENNAQLREQLAPWLKAGHPVDKPATVRDLPGEAGEKKKYGLKTREWEHGRDYSRAIRAFAEANGYDYVTPAGKWYFNRELRDAYARSIGRE